MLIIALIFLLGVLFLLFQIKTKNHPTELRTQRVTNLLSKIILISPAIGFIIFAILLSTVLQGRLIARSSHAFIVFILWMYATSFYVTFLKYFKDKKSSLISILGMACSVALAIVLTPLDRYCSLVTPSLYIFIYILGICLLGFVYAGYFVSHRNHFDSK